MPEIIGDIFRVRVEAELEHSFFVPIAITELRLAQVPTAVVENALAPGRALVGALVQVFPE